MVPNVNHKYSETFDHVVCATIDANHREKIYFFVAASTPPERAIIY